MAGVAFTNKIEQFPLLEYGGVIILTLKSCGIIKFSATIYPVCTVHVVLSTDYSP